MIGDMDDEIRLSKAREKLSVAVEKFQKKLEKTEKLVQDTSLPEEDLEKHKAAIPQIKESIKEAAKALEIFDKKPKLEIPAVNSDPAKIAERVRKATKRIEALKLNFIDRVIQLY